MYIGAIAYVTGGGGSWPINILVQQLRIRTNLTWSHSVRRGLLTKLKVVYVSVIPIP